MPRLELSQTMCGSTDEVYDLVCDMESYPQYMKNVQSVKVLERSYRKTVTAWFTEVEGSRIRWTELDEFDPEEKIIRYRLIKGDLAKFEGQWSILPEGQGSKVLLTLEFDLGIPLFSKLFHYVLVKKVHDNCQEMLDAFKKMMEDGKKNIYVDIT